MVCVKLDAGRILVIVEACSVMKLVMLEAGSVVTTVCAGRVLIWMLVWVTGGSVTRLVKLEAAKVEKTV